MGARGRVGCLLVASALTLAGAVGSVGTTLAAAAGPASQVAAGADPTGPTWSQIQRRLVRAGENPQLPSATPPSSASGLTAAAARSVTVTPHTDLVGGQVVTVAGHGFAGVPMVVVAQCRAGASGPPDCGLDTVGGVGPDAAGNFSVAFPVRRTIVTAGGAVSCVAAPKTCEIIATDAAVATVDAHAPISFDPNAPAPDPRVAVTPSTGVRAGDTLTVSGRRFPPNEPILVDLCGPSMVCGMTMGEPVFADGSGRFTTSVTARLRTLDAQLEPSDCLAVTCSVVAQSFFQLDYVASAPVTFDPNQPRPPIPSITLRPATGLHHLDAVEVTGTGFDPGAFVSVAQCGPGAFSCGGGDGGFAPGTEADGSGNFSATVSVSRLVGASTVFDPGALGAAAVADPGPTDDCAVVACTIEVEQFAPDDPLAPGASAALGFDATAPVPTMPVVRVKPTTRLPYRYTLRVEGTGFAPAETVLAEFCAESDDAGMCRTAPAGVVASDGTLAGTIAVQRRVSFDGATVDCVETGTVCTLRVLGEHSFEDWTVPLSFAPNAPVPPPPSLRVTPARNLRDQQVVSITGTGFLPGPVPVSECERTNDPFSYRCGGVGLAAADADGRLTGAFALTRFVGDGFGPPVDCAAAVGRCVLVAGEEESFDPPVRAALAFDPAGPVPTPATVTLTPRVNLGDGQTVALHGSGFTPQQPVLLLECRTDAESMGECDLSAFAPVLADVAGDLTADVTVHAHPRLFFGSVDCAAARRTCMIVALDLADPARSTKTPISFLVPDLEVRSTRLTEGTGGVTPAPVTVALSNPAPVPITVAWDAERDTATRADYGPTQGTVTIPAGATEVAIPLELTADALDESQERFSVRIVRAPGTRVVSERAVVTIDDDDDRPHASVADFRATEGEPFAFTLVGLDAPSGRTVTLEWHTHHDSARTGADFGWTEGTVTFLPGQQWAVVAVPLVDDGVAEGVEQFLVVLEHPVHTVVDRALGAVVVTDDD